MAVMMKDDQFQMMIGTLRGITDYNQKMNFLRIWAGAELNKLWEKQVGGLFEATREGEGAVLAHTYEQVVESTELTLIKLDQVDAAFEATREGEVAVPAHTYEQVL